MVLGIQHLGHWLMGDGDGDNYKETMCQWGWWQWDNVHGDCNNEHVDDEAWWWWW